MSKIEWTEKTWQPTHGCKVVSPGCTNCYAMRMAARLEAMGQQQYAGLTQKTKAGPVWTGMMRGASDAELAKPLGWRKPTTIFVDSMADLFGEGVPDEAIDKAFAIMALTPQHTYQVLTKRADRMREYITHWPDGAARQHHIFSAVFRQLKPSVRTGGDWSSKDPEFDRASEVMRKAGWPLPNVWLGVSCEDQERADQRIPDLLATPAAKRFLSCEPLLGPIDGGYITNGLTTKAGCFGVDWVIAGGESGPNARPWSIHWARILRDQCTAAGVPFFWKQNGEWRPAGSRPSETPGRFAFGDYEHDPSRMIQVDHYPRQFTMFGARSVMERVGKKSAGAMLDGVLHRGMPA